ncbi:ThuA domain-containing protein [Sphaerisporangium sp. TRM90804]|uniref:ThuA domain-containing protein n=1 Tax=Sphaerisporangium sp. TRM90804 TaxID=3031113 RepID=UPI002447210E|nr:ThuA domain-containing protein [Sphaerisporangium sp. TRM90804]MDH2425226.1 ThuA domain-containing protein [Sphaerisporangium sp. TRM90804]
MATNLILSGGVAHDFPATSAALAGVLSEVGVESTVTEDIAGALTAGAEFDLITVNALRCWNDGGWSAGEGGAPFRLPPEGRDTLRRHLARGGGMLAVHAASICFDDWDGWARTLGASWRWGVSGHPPLGPAEVKVHGGHPIVDGLADFELVDEVYSDLDVLTGVQPLASSLGQPLVWARPAGQGRLVYDALGHDTRSYDSPAHRTLLRRAALWLLRRPLDG